MQANTDNVDYEQIRGQLNQISEQLQPISAQLHELNGTIGPYGDQIADIHKKVKPLPTILRVCAVGVGVVAAVLVIVAIRIIVAA